MPSGGITVLVVDDEPSLRLLCRVNLELEGYRVIEAGSVPDARRLLAAEDVAVMLLDVHVGPDDGRDLLDELRAAEADVRVALLTGSVEANDRRDAGADRVITKPFEPTELAATVAELSSPDFRAHVDSVT